jgi:putative oxidoreductase
MMSLQGKTAIVTGASRGIGLAITRALAAEGAHVVGAARTVTDDLEQAASRAYALDLASETGPRELVERTLAEFGRLDVLVNNVGAFDARIDGFASVTDAQWLATLEINLLSTVRAIRAGLPSIVEHRGTIVNIGSISARIPQVAVVDYAAAKAALINLSQTLAEELGPQGVTVNTVSPGPTRTPAWESRNGFGAALATASGQALDEFLASFPAQAGLSTGRLTEPDEVAAVVVLLATGRARNINGANLVVDGGQDKTAA